MNHIILQLHKKLFAMPWAALALIAAGLGSLSGAFILQTFFGVEPCVLCLFQRIPYAVVVVLGAVALLFRQNDKVARALLGLCALAFFINVGIAIFHSGVELQWWAGTDGCEVNADILRDPEAARLALLKTAVAQCDEVNFTFLGFSLANWNILICLALGLFAMLAAMGPCVNWAKPSCGCCKNN